MAATEDILGKLHELTAQQMIEMLKEGVPVEDKVTGEVTRAPVPAPYLATIVKFLKDNGIEALPAENETLGKLANSLPDFSADVPLRGERLS